MSFIIINIRLSSKSWSICWSQLLEFCFSILIYLSQILYGLHLFKSIITTSLHDYPFSLIDHLSHRKTFLQWHRSWSMLDTCPNYLKQVSINSYNKSFKFLFERHKESSLIGNRPSVKTYLDLGLNWI